MSYQICFSNKSQTRWYRCVLTKNKEQGEGTQGPHQTWKTASGLKNKEQGEGNEQGKNKAEGGLLQIASARIWHKA